MHVCMLVCVFKSAFSFPVNVKTFSKCILIPQPLCACFYPSVVSVMPSMQIYVIFCID